MLDAELPGGGWPSGSLVEILQGNAGRHVWQLLLPTLASLGCKEEGPLVLVNPPHLPFGPALAAQGISHNRLLRIEARQPKPGLWASEQALRCADVIAVLAWLPNCRPADLRRLHLAAAQHHKMLFVFRGLEARNDSSPARIRIAIADEEGLKVELLKRRGPPLVQPIELPAHPVRLQHLLDSRKRRRDTAISRERSHVLDRTVAIA